jgi:hypothetical protein
VLIVFPRTDALTIPASNDNPMLKLDTACSHVSTTLWLP